MDGYDRQPQDRDVNGSNTDGYNWYRIYFHIFVRIRSWILIVLVLVRWDCNGYRHHINVTFSIQIWIGYRYWISRIEYGRIKNLSNRIEFEYGRKISVLFTSVHKCMWKILDWTGLGCFIGPQSCCWVLNLVDHQRGSDIQDLWNCYRNGATLQLKQSRRHEMSNNSENWLIIHTFNHFKLVESESKSTYGESTTTNLFLKTHTCDKRLQCNKI